MHFDYTIEMKLLFYSPILISKIMEAKGSTTPRGAWIQAQGFVPDQMIMQNRDANWVGACNL